MAVDGALRKVIDGRGPRNQTDDVGERQPKSDAEPGYGRNVALLQLEVEDPQPAAVDKGRLKVRRLGAVVGDQGRIKADRRDPRAIDLHRLALNLDPDGSVVDPQERPRDPVAVAQPDDFAGARLGSESVAKDDRGPPRRSAAS